MTSFGLNAKYPKRARKGRQGGRSSLRSNAFATFAFSCSDNRRCFNLKTKTGSWIFLFLLLLMFPLVASAQPASSAPSIVEASSLNREITDFLDKEMAAHLSEIKSYDPAPDKVFDAGASGEYTWGTFMNSVGAYAALTGKRTLGNRDLAHEVGQIGLLEHRLKGTRFSQLYGVLALRFFGRDLNSNSVWQRLNETEPP